MEHEELPPDEPMGWRGTFVVIEATLETLMRFLAEDLASSAGGEGGPAASPPAEEAVQQVLTRMRRHRRSVLRRRREDQKEAFPAGEATAADADAQARRADASAEVLLDFLARLLAERHGSRGRVRKKMNRWRRHYLAGQSEFAGNADEPPERPTPLEPASRGFFDEQSYNEMWNAALSARALTETLGKYLATFLARDSDKSPRQWQNEIQADFEERFFEHLGLGDLGGPSDGKDDEPSEEDSP